MKRPVITADIMQRLLVGAAGTVNLPSNALLTPSALDLARAQGIAIVRTQPAADAAAVESACSSANLTPPVADTKSDYTDSPDSDESFAAIRQAVLEQLTPELRSSPLVDALIRKATQQHHDNTEALKDKGVSSVSLAPTQGAPEQAAPEWRKQANGIIRVNSKRLPWQDFPGATLGNMVNIADVIGSADNSPMGVGYLELDRSGFDWFLDYSEVNIVLEGELHITSGGQTLKAFPGDTTFIPKGTSLRFESPGRVKFVYVTWPADWSGA